MSHIPLIDPLAPKPKVEVANTPTPQVEPANLEEATLNPPVGIAVRPLSIGTFGESIPALIDPRSYTLYPKRK